MEQRLRKFKGWAPRAMIAAAVLLMVAVEWLFHAPDMLFRHPFGDSPLFPLWSLWLEDWATYGFQFALFIPIGVLLWRFCAHGRQWFAMVMGAMLLWEIFQPVLEIDYFRLYNLLAAALGLLAGLMWNAALNWASGGRAALWAMLVVGAGVALAAENMRVHGYTPYEAVTLPYREYGYVVQVILWYGVLAGKAVCLSSIAAGLGEKKWRVWLCAALLCLTAPRDLWLRGMIAPLRFLPYGLCAAGFALFDTAFLFSGSGALQGQEPAKETSV